MKDENAIEDDGLDTDETSEDQTNKEPVKKRGLFGTSTKTK